MRISAAFPGQYLKAADLEGRQVTVSIDHVKMEDIGGDTKPVVYFIGKERGLVLNKTNANNIGFLYGDETDDWHGKQITMYEAMVDFQGRSTAAIRVKGPARPEPQRGAQPQRRMDPISSGPPQDHPVNDDIPF